MKVTNIKKIDLICVRFIDTLQMPCSLAIHWQETTCRCLESMTYSLALRESIWDHFMTKSMYLKPEWKTSCPS
jgi:hypothetical protein